VVAAGAYGILCGEDSSAVCQLDACFNIHGDYFLRNSTPTPRRIPKLVLFQPPHTQPSAIQKGMDMQMFRQLKITAAI
jgi:hypothetical protein